MVKTIFNNKKWFMGRIQNYSEILIVSTIELINFYRSQTQ